VSQSGRIAARGWYGGIGVVSRALADGRSEPGRHQMAAEISSRVLCWWVRSLAAVVGRLPERLWQDCRINARCGVLLGLPGLSARVGGRLDLRFQVAALCVSSCFVAFLVEGA
jgi:hypothetical protein